MFRTISVTAYMAVSQGDLLPNWAWRLLAELPRPLYLSAYHICKDSLPICSTFHTTMKPPSSSLNSSILSEAAFPEDLEMYLDIVGPRLD